MVTNPLTARICFRGWAITRLGVVSTLLGLAAPEPGAQGQSVGPDAVASFGNGFEVWGRVGGTQAYSADGGVCNLGDEPLPGNLSSNHPMWTSNLYRLSDVGFEQIGMSWVKHDAWDSDINPCNACGSLTCNNCLGQGCPPALDPGCKDIYGCQNGCQNDQGNLGPRSQINPATGLWPVSVEHASYCDAPSSGGVIACRLQVAALDLEEEFVDALYFLEEQVISPDETSVMTQNNNASYTDVTVGYCDPNLCNGPVCASNCLASRSCTQSSCIHPLTIPASENCQDPAIYAWASLDPGVELDLIQVPDDGLLILGAKATNRGAVGWDYEYALYNMNSDRAVGSFTLTFSAGTVVGCRRIGFHDINYHSTEIWEGTDWTWNACTLNVPMTELKWEAQPYSENANANALRWGTVYNFRFRSPSAPHSGGVTATLGLFKPPLHEGPTSVSAVTIGP